jgi:hypothetical protein
MGNGRQRHEQEQAVSPPASGVRDGAAGAGAAVEVDDGHSCRRPHLLAVEVVAIADIEMPCFGRLRRGIGHAAKYDSDAPRLFVV